MALRGTSKRPVPYVPEEERSVLEDQTVVWIRPKNGHSANKTMARYAAAGRDGRKGYRELNIRKLDDADIEEFLEVVVKWENYYFSDSFPKLHEQGLIKVIEDQETLKKICLDLPADILMEIFEAANNISRLNEGEKKSYSSPHTSASGKAKPEKG